MDNWTGIISILSLLSGNVEGHLNSRFPTEEACKAALTHDVPLLQKRFDDGGDSVKLIARCILTIPEDSF